MPHETVTVNVALPARRYSRPYAITLSDVITDRNLQRDRRPYRWIQNLGADGLVMIAWEPDGSLQAVQVNKGVVLEMGYCMHAMSTGTTAGGPIIGFAAVEGRDVS